MMNSVALRYARYAAALLALTLIAGVFLRGMFTFPALRGSISGPHLLHAHSHAGFFGWAVMGACALATTRLHVNGAAALAHRLLAHAIGIGSVAAFVGFALRGYDMVTIPLSAAHVLLWCLFVALVWRPLAVLPRVERVYLRCALAFLVIAGAATVAPVLVMMRGVSDPWLQQLAVKAFLTPFVTGFLLLAALGMAGSMLRWRRALPPLVLIAAGALPSTLLYVSAAAPAAWLNAVGRTGIGLVGGGLLLWSYERARERQALSPLAAMGVTSAAIVGVLKLLAAAGVGAAFMHSRSIVVAIMHVVLLGIITPAFVAGLRPELRAPRRTAVYATGLAVMVAALAAMGWPWLLLRLLGWGVTFNGLLLAAFAGGVSAAAGLVALLLVLPDAAPAAASVRSVPRSHVGRGAQTVA